MSTPIDPNIQTAVDALRDPDHAVTGDRTTTFVWDLGPDPEGGTQQAVLAIVHHKRSRGGTFAATLLNRAEDGSEQRMGSITDWTRLKNEPVARYSKTAHEQFASSTLAELHSIYSQNSPQGEQVRAYFTVKPWTA